MAMQQAIIKTDILHWFLHYNVRSLGRSSWHTKKLLRKNLFYCIAPIKT